MDDPHEADSPSAEEEAQHEAEASQPPAEAVTSIPPFVMPDLTQSWSRAIASITSIPPFVMPDLTQSWSRAIASIAPSLEGLAEGLDAHRRRLLPLNLHSVDFSVEDLRRLADEGIVLWSVPRPEIAQRLIDAPTYGARREVLGRRGQAILEDCRSIAAHAAAGPYAPHARELEKAIAAGQAGYVGPAISHLASVIDTIMRNEIEESSRLRLVRHPKAQHPMDHFTELPAQSAMVFRPIWFAYRKMETEEQRTLSTSFARHGVAHDVTGRQALSFRNFVQAAMLSAALLDYLSWWSGTKTNNINSE
ncbi:hypothetical protein [Sanguibacter suaedae]|uniref:Uncharacterized protein n=1 Tax=Sanguibacter suaedae TaxID=2795737 RepID=A0A934I4X1_9MICO|nr:hypothetical protein [Sanguibacter suaedae]MBI9115278.1 hypothetical protein [Sanguibacter suaedae]